MLKIYIKITLLFSMILCISCTSTTQYNKTASHINLKKFMGKWYVIASRPTFLEKNAYNSVEEYKWNSEKQRIEIDFSFNKGSLDGPVKHIKQTARVYNIDSNAHWEVSPIWPLKFGYLILTQDPNEQWAAIGVPSQRYIWILSRSPKMSAQDLNYIKHELVDLDYRVDNLEVIRHNP